MNGILNILKPPGMTSHDVVSVIRKKLNTKKVGHTGTLDPNAAGVLPICIGKATKISQFLLEGTKKYRAELKLGIETDTQDIYGKVINKYPVTSTEKEIKKAILNFVGDYNQVPPMYSAIKIKGKKLYELARQGIEVEREPRKVKIYNIDIIKINDNKILFDVVCSKGTYIRTLCNDIGKLLGCGGTMSFLIRTESSDFNLDTTIALEELDNIEYVEKILLPLDFPLKHMKKIMVKPSYSKQILNGNPILSHYLSYNLNDPLETKVRIYLEDQFIGIGIVKCDGHGQKYIKFLKFLFERK